MALISLKKTEYPFVLLSKPESPIRSTKYIAGKKMAFGDKHFTQEHSIPRTMLYEFGIPFDGLTKPGNTSSHDNYAKAVISGEYDLYKIQSEREDCPEQRGSTRIVHYSHHYPSNGISTDREASPPVSATARNALLDLISQGQDKPELYSRDRTEIPKNFVQSQETNYQALHKWAIKIGLLSGSDKLRQSNQ